MKRVSYQPILPVIAVWSVEFSEAIGVVFVQIDGTDVNVVGSRLWHFASLHEALEGLQDYPWRKRIETHVIPPDPGGAFAKIFEAAELDVESCAELNDAATVYLTRELFPLLSIDESAREWIEEENNNALLVESINGYRVERVRKSETYSAKPTHTWERYLVRALEVFALWRHGGGVPGWGPKPSNELALRGAI